jgi:ubiquitin-conjugating enzyme E2 M
VHAPKAFLSPQFSSTTGASRTPISCADSWEYLFISSTRKDHPTPALWLVAGHMFQLPKTSKNARIARETGRVNRNSGQLRISKDVNELDPPASITVSIPNPDDLMNIYLSLAPTDGYYAEGSFNFTVTIPDDYPHSPPKVHCTTPVYHPNIDLEGNVCLNILRQDWKPVLTLNGVLYGLQLLFLEPNPDDPLNKDAADLLKNDKLTFRRNVDHSIRGGYVTGRFFPPSRR